MTATNHMLTGTAIALAIQQPALAPVLAFLSHFILDSVPHFGDMEFYEYGHKWFPYAMALDGVLAFIGVGLSMLFAPQSAVLIGVCAILAILPDVFWLYYYMNGRPQYWFFRFHQKIQWFERPPGAIVEVCYCIFISTAIVALLRG